MDYIAFLFFEWATEHWWLGFWLAFWLAVFAYGLARGLINLTNRAFRMVLVSLRGWPPAHLDADGDWRPSTSSDA